MRTILEYCQILGVQPGDSSEKVKAAFRAKIKQFHPDKGGDVEKAKLLLEAYERLKGGVPILQTQQKPQDQQKQEKKQNENTVYKEAFREFLNRVFSNDPMILKIINDVLNQYGFDEIHFPFRVKRYYKQEDGIHSDEAMNQFLKLERMFHQIMQNFNSQKGRPIKYRALELIQDLTQLQVRYRSLMVRHPSMTYKCRQRLDQIKEIIDHAKMVL
ncbi:MAG: DnaJ domain-containing protein [Leptospiraceae bacterium]|nr:DnaJ domain-containing protein [Leptospiraceae bacterium]MDW7975215.1 DnaJ domain-containing protein [Leptospiraceae bacterium]